MTTENVVDQSERLANIHTNGVDWKTRTVWIIGELTEQRAHQYLPALRLLDETPGTIRIVLSSVGGEEPGGFAIYDVLRSLQNRVYTFGYGEVCSIAALIFQAGSKRFLSPSCQLMMHNGTVSVEKSEGGMNSDFIKQLAEEAIRNDARYHQAIADRTQAELSAVEGWCAEERYFSAAEAVEAKLAYSVFTGVPTHVE